MYFFYRTPLHASAYVGNMAALQLALTCGSDVNSVDCTGRSALMTAAENGHTSAVGLYCFYCLVLCINLCRVVVCSIYFKRCIFFSSLIDLLNFYLVLDVLLHRARADLSLLDINRNSALHMACRRVMYPSTRSVLLHNIFCVASFHYQ